MNNRYKEVLMTYLRRPFSSRRAVWFLAIGLYLLLSASGGRSGHLDPDVVFGGVAILGGLLWLQFREHVASHGRKLTPGYAYAQFGVFAGLAIALLSAAALCFALIAHANVMASLALAVAIFGMIGIYIAFNSYTIFVICMLLFFGSRLYADKMPVFLTGQSTLAAAMVLGCGLIGTIWSMVRLLNITEEQYGYRSPLELRYSAKNQRIDQSTACPKQLQRKAVYYQRPPLPARL